jgi:hypothetical protein
MGFVVYEEKLSRVDMQVLIDIPVEVFELLRVLGHFVYKAHKVNAFENGSAYESITIGGDGSDVQWKIYNKPKQVMQKLSPEEREQFIESGLWSGMVG